MTCDDNAQWFVCIADSTGPIAQEIEQIHGSSPVAVTTPVRGLVMVTQTCDIVRTCADRPYIKLAPLVEVNATELREIKKLRRLRYAFVPEMAESRLVADLDRIMTVEKSIVAGWTRTPGWTTDVEARGIANALTRMLTRFAFPDEFVKHTHKLQRLLKDKHDKRSPVGEALRALREIRVRAAPSWNAPQVKLLFWFIRDGETESFAGKNWEQFLEEWRKLVPASFDRFVRSGRVVALEDLNAQDYVESERLDLDYLSTPSA